MATYNDILKANTTIATKKIKGSEYAMVNQRINAFRSLYPEGFIITTISDGATKDLNGNSFGKSIARAEVGYYSSDGTKVVLATGHAYEVEGTSQVNQTSYIENCETSAVGRALGMMGLGIEASIASAEEVENAIYQQEVTKKPTAQRSASAVPTPPPAEPAKPVAEQQMPQQTTVPSSENNNITTPQTQPTQTATAQPQPSFEVPQTITGCIEKLNELGVDYTALLKYYKVKTIGEMRLDMLQNAVLRKMGKRSRV